MSPGDIAARFIITDEDGRPVGTEDFPGRHVVAGEPAAPLLTRSVLRETGKVYWLLTKATTVREPDGRVFAVNVIEDLTEAKEAERRQRFLADAAARLASSLDYEETLEHVAQLIVPQLADWCAIDVLDDRDGLRRLTLARADSELDVPPPAGLDEVLSTGRPQLHPTALLVPMSVAGRTTGVMSLSTAGSAREFGSNDVAFFEQLAMLAAAAVENSRLYPERKTASETLQRSLLPARLPAPPGWRAAAWYQPGAPGVEVGGDFYDLFSVNGAYLALMGDVTGKGVQAAALTALARHTARTAALFDSRLAAVLSRLNRVLRDQPSPSLVTLACARLEPGGMISVASAGHPLPLRAPAAGGAAAIGGHGLLLGADEDVDWAERPVRMTPGDTLLFYTDGIVDTPGEGERFGEERLARLVAQAPREPRELLASVEEALHDFQAE